MRRFAAALATALVVSGCSFETDLEALTFGCESDSECASGQVCDPVAQICVLAGTETDAALCPNPCAPSDEDARRCHVLGITPVVQVCRREATEGCFIWMVDETCDDGHDCTDDLCDVATLSCSHPLTTGCLIPGSDGGLACFAEGSQRTVEGATAPEPCEACAPDLSTTSWSIVTDGRACPDDGLPCTDDVCTEASGVCAHPLNEGCLIDGACVEEGQGPPDAPCKVCNPQAGSTTGYSDKPNGAACDDDDACTLNDVCEIGLCVGEDKTAEVCDDQKACTTDACVSETGECTNTPLPNWCIYNGVCVPEDASPGGNPCLTCQSAEDPQGLTLVADGGLCDDGNPCTVGDRCVDSVCTPLSAKGCDDGLPCTVDACDDSSGVCEHQTGPGQCLIAGQCVAEGEPNPANLCQACRPSLAQEEWSPREPGTACDDGSLCTEGDACLNGQCQPGEAKDCGDEFPCTTDGCVELTGECSNEVTEGCVIDNACVGEGVPMAGKPCMLCNTQTSKSQWSNQSAGTPCDDGDACTQDDACLESICVAGPLMDCDDGLPCTLDNCEPSTGECSHVLDTQHCLIDGQCISAGLASPLNPCLACQTDDTPHAYSPRPAGSSCSDGDVCTLNDTCQTGVCIGGELKFCTDGLPCTEDVCVSEGDLGCTSTLDESCLIDGACAAEGTIGPGGCQICDLTTAVDAWTPLGAGEGCDDGDPCTVEDGCVEGTCVAGPPVDCDDGLDCTSDSCDGSTGACVSEAVSGCLIAGQCVASGEVAPGNPCSICNPEVADTGWHHVTDGQPCYPYPNGEAVCVTGQCEFTCSGTPEAEWADCDQESENGCESDIWSDTFHCGACDQPCQSGQVCVAGLCNDSCAQASSGGLTKCGGVCVDLTSSTSHCGECGDSCAAENAVAACVDGQCEVAQCDAGWVNRDQDDHRQACAAETLAELLEVGVTPSCAACFEAQNTCTLTACAEVCDEKLTGDECLACLQGDCYQSEAFASCSGVPLVASEDSGLCLNSTDVSTLGNNSHLPSNMEYNAHHACSQASGLLLSYGECVAVYLTNPLTGGCASCYGDRAGCLHETCPTCNFSDGQWGWSGDCGECYEQCSTSIASCTGLPSSSASEPLACVNVADLSLLEGLGIAALNQDSFYTCLASTPDGCECQTTGDEVCDGVDNNCSGQVDDVTQASLDVDPVNCGSCGNPCPSDSPAMVGVCDGGLCGEAPCPDGAVNLDGLPANGCEYLCASTSDDELCSGVDEDCDGLIDEGFDLSSDTDNCGACGHGCATDTNLETVLSYACHEGACEIATCSASYEDANGAFEDGCEKGLYITDDKTFFVDWITGDDIEGIGSPEVPFATIQAAIDLVPLPGWTIQVAEGTYSKVHVDGHCDQGVSCLADEVKTCAQPYPTWFDTYVPVECMPGSSLGDGLCDAALNCAETEWDAGDCPVGGHACDPDNPWQNLLDCYGSCVQDLRGNGSCEYALDCEALDYDGGDCDPYAPCAWGAEIRTCSGVCLYQWDAELQIGDGTCHTRWNCAEHDLDGGDCPASDCPPDERPDCQGGCAPVHHLGDGLCDAAFNCEDFEWDASDCGRGLSCVPGVYDGLTVQGAGEEHTIIQVPEGASVAQTAVLLEGQDVTLADLTVTGGNIGVHARGLNTLNPSTLDQGMSGLRVERVTVQGQRGLDGITEAFPDGGDAIGVLLDVTVNATLSDLHVQQVEAGSGLSTLDETERPVGHGGESVGILLRRSQGATLEAPQVNTIRGGEAGRYLFTSGLGMMVEDGHRAPFAGRATGIWLDRSRQSVVADSAISSIFGGWPAMGYISYPDCFPPGSACSSGESCDDEGFCNPWTEFGLPGVGGDGIGMRITGSTGAAKSRIANTDGLCDWHERRRCDVLCSENEELCADIESWLHAMTSWSPDPSTMRHHSLDACTTAVPGDQICDQALNCAAWGFDGGDCDRFDSATPEPCPDGTVRDPRSTSKGNLVGDGLPCVEHLWAGDGEGTSISMAQIQAVSAGSGGNFVRHLDSFEYTEDMPPLDEWFGDPWLKMPAEGLPRGGQPGGIAMGIKLEAGVRDVTFDGLVITDLQSGANRFDSGLQEVDGGPGHRDIGLQPVFGVMLDADCLGNYWGLPGASGDDLQPSTVDDYPIVWVHDVDADAGLTLSGLDLTDAPNLTNLGQVLVHASSGVVVSDLALGPITGAAGVTGCSEWRRRGFPRDATGLRIDGCDTCTFDDIDITGIAGGRAGDAYCGGTGGIARGVMLTGETTDTTLRDITITELRGGYRGTTAYKMPVTVDQVAVGVWLDRDSFDNTIEPTVTVGGAPVVFHSEAQDLTLNPTTLGTDTIAVPDGVTLTNWGQVVVFDSRNVTVEDLAITGGQGLTGQTNRGGTGGQDGGDVYGLRLDGCQGCSVHTVHVEGLVGGHGGTAFGYTFAGMGGNAVGVSVLGETEKYRGTWFPWMNDPYTLSVKHLTVADVTGGAGGAATSRLTGKFSPSVPEGKSGSGGVGEGVRIIRRQRYRLTNGSNDYPGGSSLSFDHGDCNSPAASPRNLVEWSHLRADIGLGGASNAPPFTKARLGIFQGYNPIPGGDTDWRDGEGVPHSWRVPGTPCCDDSLLVHGWTSRMMEGDKSGYAARTVCQDPITGLNDGFDSGAIEDIEISGVTGGAGGAHFVESDGSPVPEYHGWGGESVGLYLAHTGHVPVERVTVRNIGGGQGNGGGDATGIMPRVITTLRHVHVTGIEGGTGSISGGDARGILPQPYNTTGWHQTDVAHLLAHDLRGGDGGVFGGDSVALDLTRSFTGLFATLADLQVGQAAQSSGDAVGLRVGDLDGETVDLSHLIIWGTASHCVQSDDANGLDELLLDPVNLSQCGLSVADLGLGISLDGITSWDPGFVDAEGGDYGLSPGSPLIDAGDAGAASCAHYHLEPEPNGCANNLGAFGGTTEATAALGADHCACLLVDAACADPNLCQPHWCLVSCDDVACGSYCGLDCGGCADGQACVDNACCTPDCGDAQCGEDGCGGSCGGCSGTEVCEEGACTACTPDCEGKACGDDGCGGSCGTCEANAICQWSGDLRACVDCGSQKATCEDGTSGWCSWPGYFGDGQCHTRWRCAEFDWDGGDCPPEPPP